MISTPRNLEVFPWTDEGPETGSGSAPGFPSGTVCVSPDVRSPLGRPDRPMGDDFGGPTARGP